MRLKLVKEAIRDVVNAANIPDLDCYSFVPDKPHTPCFYAGEASIDPNNSFGPRPGGHDEAQIVCRVLVAAADDADAQALLDEYLSDAGPYSIRAALLAGRGAPGQLALNGTCDDFSITRIDGYRMIPGSNQDAFYGAQITLRIIGS